MRLLIEARRSTWLLAGLALRILLLAWGTYQDKHATLPYTDVDYQVFTGAARAVYAGCPLDAIITGDGPQEDYADLADPPEAKGRCAQGVLPAVARLMLQTEQSIEELADFPRSGESIKAATANPGRPKNDDGDDYDDDDDDADVSAKDKQQQQGGRGDISYIFFTRVVPGIFTATRPAFRLVASLGNPYARDTYRYTPLLALLLTPAQALEAAAARNVFGRYSALAVTAAALFGKLLFVVADIAVALLMWDIMDVRAKGRQRHHASRHFGWLVGILWLVNPFPAQISTRGSSESLLGVLVLGFLDLTLRGFPEESLPALSAPEAQSAAAPADKGQIDEEHVPDMDTFSNVRVMAPLMFALAIHWKLYPVIYAASLIAHLGAHSSHRGVRDVAQFGGLSLYSLVLVSGLVTALWGWPYITETILYHLRRADHRHNFSPFFLAAHLGDFVERSAKSGASNGEQVLLRVATLIKAYQSLLTFVPQLALTTYVGFSFGGQDLVAALTLQTMVFVALNKVCTSQYFMWFLWFLPLLAPYLSFGRSSSSSSQKVPAAGEKAAPRRAEERTSGAAYEVLLLVGVWVGAQALWLSQAYLLEFQGLDVYLRTWLASLFVLFAHTFLIVRLVKAWTRGRTALTLAEDVDERAQKAESEKAQ